MRLLRLTAVPGRSREPSIIPPGNACLHSWKEIACYMRHGVRTVQRWEREGLPVHRHFHDKRDSVYAYASELDAWWTRRKPSIARLASPGRIRRIWITAALMILCLMLILLAEWWWK